MLLLAHTRSGPIYRVGFNNFHALLSYNYSKLYVMAVNALAQAIAHRVHALPATAVAAAGPDRQR